MSKHTNHYLSVSSREKSWGLYVTGLGHSIIEVNERYPSMLYPANHDFQWERGRILEEFALLYIADGSGTFESTHQTQIDIHAGDCLMLFPGEWHRYRPEQSVGWEEYWVIFHGSLVDAWRQAKLICPQTPLLLSGEKHLLLPQFEDMLRLTEQKSSRRPLEIAALCHLLVARLFSISTNQGHQASKDERLREAGDYLRTHPEDDIDFPKLAKQLGMSYSNFRRSFMKHFGSSPGKFHQDARVTRVKQLLIETTLSLKEIAEKLHYSNEFYMMQVFKQHTGLTPTQWRHRRVTS